ncbi:MAG: hydroxyacid dehydrogenase [Pseudomonadota bacterium]
MSDVVITEFMDQAAVDDLSSRFRVTYDSGLVDRPKDLAAFSDCRALIVRNRTQVRGAVLDALPQLTCVGRLGVGLDNIDVADCKSRGITVYPATGANDLAVAEYVIAMTLVLLRGAFGATQDVADGAWPRKRLMGRETSGRTLGLIGFGSIARETATRAAALGMTIIATDPFVTPDDPAWLMARPVDMQTLLAQADVISLHVPLTEETQGLIGAAQLVAMRQGTVLINAARGGVVDEAALADALKAGHLGGAALDVFAEEPLAAGSPLAGAPNLILTPHIAGVTHDSNIRVSQLIAEKIATHLEGLT